ncbi:hypothetical protein ACIRQY_22975 [Streptomyces sp. NPDC101490]|uniref:hypothetical protein n=1 Tax=Streptomyces sp. NPDC101490 TaxID=3366143 RepID=UPI0037F9E2F7
MQLRAARLQVVGFGPAALGIPIAADRTGLLDDLMREGCVFLDRRGRNEWRSLDYDIPSNSAAGDFLEGLSPDGRLRAVLRSPEVRALQEAPDQPVALRVAARFLARTAREIADYTVRFDGAHTHFSTSVDHLSRDADGLFHSRDARGRTLALSRSAVIAVGARPLAGAAPRTVTSEAVLRRECDAQCEAAVGAGTTIRILGGSHSAFSTVGLLLREWGDLLRPGQIQVQARSEILVYRPEARAAVTDGRTGAVAVGGTADVGGTALVTAVSETRPLHRFAGLRGESEALYRAVLHGAEPRVRLLCHPEENDPAASPLTIAATGYRARRLPVLDVRGQPLFPPGEAAVDEEGRVLDGRGRPVPGLFGIGLGHCSPVGPASGDSGYPMAAVNVFHGRTADRIVAQL